MGARPLSAKIFFFWNFNWNLRIFLCGIMTEFFEKTKYFGHNTIIQLGHKTIAKNGIMAEILVWLYDRFNLWPYALWTYDIHPDW